MYILGLNIGHNSSAALLKDGKIINCVEEERFTRQKNHAGMPINAIDYFLKQNNISMRDINFIISDGYMHPNLKDHNFPRYFEEQYTKKSLKKRVLSKIGYKFPSLKRKWWNIKWKILLKNRKLKEMIFIRKKISKILDFPENKIIIIPHTKAHAFATCFNLKKNEKTLIFTLDGESEEGLCASINIFDGENLKTVSQSTKLASMGYLYSNATLYLGMKPGQHEFKIMGLAPYAKQIKVNELYDKSFKELIWIGDNLELKSKFDMVHADLFFIKEMKYKRFDIIAGAVQKLVEEKTSEWVTKAIKKYGIKNIALTGGVFMNVKANMKIAQLKNVKNLFIMPSAGDESTCIGDCFYGYWLYCKKNKIKFEPKPIEDLFLGPEYDDEYIKNLIKTEKLDIIYSITKPKNINLEIAKLLARSEIVARCTGKSEWGARSLGNRSILANPSNKETIRILNESIKGRDFWMPFTPSILAQ